MKLAAAVSAHRKHWLAKKKKKKLARLLPSAWPKWRRRRGHLPDLRWRYSGIDQYSWYRCQPIGDPRLVFVQWRIAIGDPKPVVCYRLKYRHYLIIVDIGSISGIVFGDDIDDGEMLACHSVDGIGSWRELASLGLLWWLHLLAAALLCRDCVILLMVTVTISIVDTSIFSYPLTFNLTIDDPDWWRFVCYICCIPLLFAYCYIAVIHLLFIVLSTVLYRRITLKKYFDVAGSTAFGGGARGTSPRRRRKGWRLPGGWRYPARLAATFSWRAMAAAIPPVSASERSRSHLENSLCGEAGDEENLLAIQPAMKATSAMTLQPEMTVVSVVLVIWLLYCWLSYGEEGESEMTCNLLKSDDPNQFNQAYR